MEFFWNLEAQEPKVKGITLPPEVLERASAWTYLAELSVPYSVHHGLYDAQVTRGWSFELCQRLKALKKPVECFSYPGGHLFRGEVDQAFRQRAFSFLLRALR